jgi:hypothetical protein
VGLRGPTFSRVFVNSGGFYSDRIKHVFGPEATWSYRTRVDDFDLIPKFDGTDYVLGTHQLRYGLVQRFLAKRPGRGGKLQTHEFFFWSLDQTYYVQIGEGQNEFDPNYSASAFGPGGVPSHYSPVSSRMRFRPTPAFLTTFNLEYDVNFKQIRNMSLASRVNHRRLSLVANWSRRKRISEVAEERVVTSDFLRGTIGLEILPGRLRFDGGADYNILTKDLLSARGRLRWDVQCCGFVAEVLQYDYNERVERQIRFSIELANIGSVGNGFLGEDGPQAGRGR